MTLADLPWDIIIEALGFTIGLVYLWWEYHADPRLWLVSLIMPLISMWIYFHKGLYADFTINIYYFVIAIYGYIAWTRKSKGDAEAKETENKDKGKDTIPITHIPGRMALLYGALALALWGALYCVLRFLTDSTVPLADAYTTALSIVGMLLLARKYIEQWIVWILVDAVCVGLYIYKGIYLYSILYAIYTVIAFVGYFNWRKMITPHS